MATRVQWLGHACLLIESDGKKILIDPFLTNNPKAAARPEDVEADIILVSHGHEDHLGDTVAIAGRTGATVVSTYEMSNYLKTQGLTRLHGMQHGGGHQVDPSVHVKLTVAFHGSTLPGGGYGGNPCGFLITLADGTKIYDACDTALFGDMKLIGEDGLDLAAVPIGDYYTMGPADAVKAVKLLQPRLAMPIHYSTFVQIEQDPHAWASRVGSETAAKAVVPQPGDWVEVR